MEVHNRDLFPPEEVVSLYNDLAPLITSAAVDEKFVTHEEEALRAKRSYHFRGRVGMVLVVLSTLFTIADVLVMKPFRGKIILDYAFIVCGVVGIAIQLYLLATGSKQRWLLHRFAAERLRSIKFQAYFLAATATNSAELAVLVQAYHAGEIARLDMELNAGVAALNLFSPAHATRVEEDKGTAKNPALNDIARSAYRDLRVNYQLRFASAEAEALQRRQRIGYTSTDFLYLTGAILAVGSLVSRALFALHSDVAHWVDFVAIAAFVLGLTKSLLDNASLSETSKARYEDYVRDIQEMSAEMKEEKATLSQLVGRMERVVLGELKDFCTAASQISYRM